MRLSMKITSAKLMIAILEYLLMFLIVIEFNTPYTYFPLIGKIVNFVPLILFSFFLILNIKNVKLDIFFLILLFCSFLPALNVVNGQYSRYVKLYIVFLPLCFLYFMMLKSKRINGKMIFLKFSNIVVCLAGISLFFWCLGSIMGIIDYTIMIPNTWGGDRFIPTYYGLYFETQNALATSESTESIIRNSGIFNEAPMHNFVLCFALSIELFLREKFSFIKSLVLLVTIFTTLSTTGFLVLLFLISCKLYIVYGAKVRRYFVLVIPLLFLLLLYLTSGILENKKETGESSYSARSEDIIRCIEVGLENPILGVGLFHEGDEFGKKENRFGFSNSLFGIFAHGGFYVSSLYFCALFIFPFIIFRKTKDKGLLTMQMCFFLLFTFTLSQYRYLTLFVLCYNLAMWDYLFLNKKRTIKLAK